MVVNNAVNKAVSYASRVITQTRIQAKQNSALNARHKCVLTANLTTKHVKHARMGTSCGRKQQLI